MKYAIIKDGVVVNVIEYETQPSTPPPGFEEGHTAIQQDYVSVGWHYANGTFTDPNPPEAIETPASYIINRVAAYPSIAEQLDMQYWDGVNGTTIWADTVASVKSENPKP
jgi:hypothetical protein